VPGNVFPLQVIVFVQLVGCKENDRYEVAALSSDIPDENVKSPTTIVGLLLSPA